MKMSLTGRIILTVLCFGIALAGFMVKLPAVFRHHDTELHTLFYFLAAGFLNILFVKRSLAGHLLVFALLYLMGMGIEYAQEYSNSLVRQPIHGRYDSEDIDANLKGLVYFSVVWAGYIVLWYATRSTRSIKSITAVPDLPPDLQLTRNAGASLQTVSSPQSFANALDKQELRTAMGLLNEIINRNPGHPLAVQLQVTVAELKRIIQDYSAEPGSETD